ncbi:hypothetical protein DM02DRAFT_659260 [Periconia macrospinosa]|uniref:Uncharacterized protein n=1 Tax=Periconia macrospinosa TaxID=97972 RepID=A0A2V1DEB0_9PLEO|nr:hypothetical protein DM02DRAFT_659260 [Periconia macrospinosa]
MAHKPLFAINARESYTAQVQVSKTQEPVLKWVSLPKDMVVSNPSLPTTDAFTPESRSFQSLRYRCLRLGFDAIAVTKYFPGMGKREGGTASRRRGIRINYQPSSKDRPNVTCQRREPNPHPGAVLDRSGPGHQDRLRQSTAKIHAIAMNDNCQPARNYSRHLWGIAFGL